MRNVPFGTKISLDEREREKERQTDLRLSIFESRIRYKIHRRLHREEVLFAEVYDEEITVVLVEV